MRPQMQERVQKITEITRIFRAICSILLLFVAWVGIAAAVAVVSGKSGINYQSITFQTASLSLGTRLILGALTAATWLVLFKGFYHLQHLFGIYSRGDIFTKESAHDLRWFGVAYILWGIMHFVWVVSLVLYLHPEQKFTAYDDTFVIGAAIVMIAWFMDVAVDLREENELTI
jgi:hypothetical protein